MKMDKLWILYPYPVSKKKLRFLITITSVFADLDDMKSAEEFEDNEPNYGV